MAPTNHNENQDVTINPVDTPHKINLKIIYQRLEELFQKKEFRLRSSSEEIEDFMAKRYEQQLKQEK